MGEPHGASVNRPLIDGDRLSGFIYGTVTGLVALGAAGSREADGTWWEVATGVALGVAALWMAHAYCELLSRFTRQRRAAPIPLGGFMPGSSHRGSRSEGSAVSDLPLRRIEPPAR